METADNKELSSGTLGATVEIKQTAVLAPRELRIYEYKYRTGSWMKGGMRAGVEMSTDRWISNELPVDGESRISREDGNKA